MRILSEADKVDRDPDRLFRDLRQSREVFVRKNIATEVSIKSRFITDLRLRLHFFMLAPDYRVERCGAIYDYSVFSSRVL